MQAYIFIFLPIIVGIAAVLISHLNQDKPYTMNERRKAAAALHNRELRS